MSTRGTALPTTWKSAVAFGTGDCEGDGGAEDLAAHQFAVGHGLAAAPRRRRPSPSAGPRARRAASTPSAAAASAPPRPPAAARCRSCRAPSASSRCRTCPPRPRCSCRAARTSAGSSTGPVRRRRSAVRRWACPGRGRPSRRRRSTLLLGAMSSHVSMSAVLGGPGTAPVWAGLTEAGLFAACAVPAAARPTTSALPPLRNACREISLSVRCPGAAVVVESCMRDLLGVAFTAGDGASALRHAPCAA